MPRFRIFLVSIFWLSLGWVARAQSVRWEPASGTLAYTQTGELQLVFEGCEPKAEPTIPAVPGLVIQRAGGQSSETSIINGHVSHTETLTYAVRPTQQTTVTIPSFAVETDKGRITVAPATYEVGEAHVGQGSVSLATVANSHFTVPPEVWAGEVFTVNYSFSVARRYFFRFMSNLEWNAAPLTAEEWSKTDPFESNLNGEPRVMIESKTRAYAKTPGSITLNAGTQLINLATGYSSYGGLFSRPNIEQYAISTNTPTLQVKPLPAGAPATFNGAVGQFTLEGKVVPNTVAVGEPITWTATLKGTGNWPDIPGLPSREVSKDFHVVQPQAKRTLKEGTLFDGELNEDVVLIPTKPGTYHLPAIAWTYFDPAKGEYQTVSTEKLVIDVSPAPLPPPVAPSGTSQPSVAGAPSTVSAPTVPLPPGAIPRDPLPGASLAPAPLSGGPIVIVFSVCAAAVLIFWAWLALRRARLTDPLRSQREARIRLSTTISTLRSANDRNQIRALLQAWQRDTAVLWGFNHATPTPRDFALASSTVNQGSAENVAGWTVLWTEAERTLYRADTPLPTDWPTRAEAALQTKTVPAFSSWRLFVPQNLFPFAAALTLLLVPHAQKIWAETSEAAYARGDFSSAEKTWRDAIGHAPTDWIAHHNLALALAQQDRWGEAAAHAAVAFAQHPEDPSVRWHLAFTTEHAGYAAEVFSPLLRGSPFDAVVRQFSAPEWQWVLLFSLVVFALGLAGLIAHAYGTGSGLLRPLSLVLLGLALLAIATAAISLRIYAPATDARAVLVWRASTLRSIPTEADTTQKTTPLSAGSLAVANKTFLGNWTRLTFSNGQTGWVRQDDLVPLWR